MVRIGINVQVFDFVLTIHLVAVVKELLMTLPQNPDEQIISEFGSIVDEFAPALDGRSFVQEFVQRRRGYDPRTGYQWPQDAMASSAHHRRFDPLHSHTTLNISSPRPSAVPPLRLRTFPSRTQDYLDDPAWDTTIIRRQHRTPSSSIGHN